MKYDDNIKFHFVKDKNRYKEFIDSLLNDKKIKDNYYYYVDMDGRYSYEYYNYYYLLTLFLNLREAEFCNNNIINPDDMYYYQLGKEKYINVFKISDDKIEYQFSICSDLFGFTGCPSSILKKFNLYLKNHSCSSNKYNYYPLSKILVEFKLGILKDIDISSKINDYIYDTRTIGGAFIWPKPTKFDNFNRDRGINSYIEDRVDKTLLEIKYYYENNSKILKPSKYKNECKWLDHFKSKRNDLNSFKNYVDYFMLNDFVDEKYNPVSIIDLKVLVFSKNKEISNEYSSEQLIKMMDNLKNMIIKRSMLIEKYLNCN